MKKKDAATDGGSGWSSAPAGRITPLDVQEKEFGVTRVGAGYRMREVDEFLDQVTDTLSALIAENERLRATGGREVAADPPPDPPGMAVDAADRGAVEAFLRREKGFLQELGELVQAHAEELRSMIRAARRDAAAPAPAATATAPTEEEPAPETAAGPVVAEEPVGPAREEAESMPDATEGPGEPEPAQETESDVADDDEGGSPVMSTGTAADEPIRLEEPEPARSHPSEKDEGDSLKELFWGEE